MALTLAELQRVMPSAKPDKVRLYHPYLSAAMHERQINTHLREAAFLAQIGHESLSLRYEEEIATGAAYEGRRDLGNVREGDGRRYKGRGLIQLTGRANYRQYGKALGVDLESFPLLAATPQLACRIAALYWHLNGLNALADARDFRGITRRINGGYNGYPDRLERYKRALAVLSKGDPATVLETPDDDPITVSVKGRLLRNEEGDETIAYLAEGVVWGPARLVAGAAGVTILSVEEGQAVLRGKGGEKVVVLKLRGKAGHSPLRGIAEAAGMGISYDKAAGICALT